MSQIKAKYNILQIYKKYNMLKKHLDRGCSLNTHFRRAFGGEEKPKKICLTGEKTTENKMARDAKKVITIKDFAFSPNILKVKVGETVLIKNEDLSGHSFTSDDGTTFDTGVFGQGK